MINPGDRVVLHPHHPILEAILDGVEVTVEVPHSDFALDPENEGRLQDVRFDGGSHMVFAVSELEKIS